jgi:hypothetical protein
MKFKNLTEKQIFTWWDLDKNLTGVKLGQRQAFCFDLLNIVDVHANKDVKEPEKLDETLQYKVGRNGQPFLCSPMSGGQVLARRIILIGGEIMHAEDFKTATAPQTGRDEELNTQVNIILNLWDKKIDELKTLRDTLKMMIEAGLSVGSSDNRIMSTGDDPRRLIGQSQ